jgi:tetratricopeptide (TPR) repeat protein
MTRILSVLIVVSCGCAVRVSAMEQPQVPDGSGHTDVQGLRHTAAQYWNQGQFEKAADCYSDILRVSEASPGAEFAEDLRSMAVINRHMGRYQEAKKYYRRELEVLQNTGNQIAAGAANGSIAEILEIEGAFDEAETSYKNAVELLDRYAGPTDVRTAAALNGMAWLYTLWGRTSKASQFVEKASAAAERALAPDDPRLIDFLDVRASFLSTTGKYSEAERVWKRALQIGGKAYPHDDSRYDEVFLHLGQAYSVVQDYRPAEEMFRRFLAIDRPRAGADAAIRAVATAELARIYMEQRRFVDAEPLFSKSVQMIESERNHVPVAYSLIRSYFGDYYMARSKWSEAETQYRSALKLREAMLGEDAPDVAASMLSLSKALGKLHRKKEAEQYQAQAASIVASQKNPAYRGDTVDVRAFRQQ